MKATVFDRLEIADVLDAGGDRIVVNARVARADNVQVYRGSDFGLKDRDTLRVFRPSEAVFDEASVKTYPHKIVTLAHPATGLSSFDRDAVGWIGDSVMRDGDFIRVPMIIAHSKAVDAVRRGVRELSVGYGMTLELKDGVSPSGEAYDAVMTNIVVDHIAIVDKARGGPELKIGDEKGTKLMKTIVVDGLTVEVADNADQIISRHIERTEKRASDAVAALGAATTAHDKAMAAKDAEIDALKAKVIDGGALDKLVADRSGILAKVKALGSKVATDGKSNAEIARLVCTEKGIATDGKSDDYCIARFDALADADPVRAALTGHQSATVGDAVTSMQAAYDKGLHDLNAWRTQQ